MNTTTNTPPRPNAADDIRALRERIAAGDIPADRWEVRS